ncbi:MAG TPA: CocE/NonD family hydrolase [Bacteroidia bacterium]|nr:CocE/NonD family hydrolase [Bacteroidia bacterium]
MKKNAIILLLNLLCALLSAQNTSGKVKADSIWIVGNYHKIERLIPMRDGVKLFTAIYIPNDSSSRHPIMFNRTPYSCEPYGEGKFRSFWRANTKEYLLQKYIMVIQDVRGRYMSEGVFEDIRPYIENKKSTKDIDEASDFYDTIDWLVKNISSCNGNVGVSGISYPGFYSTMAALSGHPALKAVSPQAPVTNWFVGDDVHHNGAFFLMDNFAFDYSFGCPRPQPTMSHRKNLDFQSDDNYDFFLRQGSLKDLTKKYMGDTMKFWQAEMNHPNNDEFWKSHLVTNHLYKIQPAMLLTGGLFDAEDCWGTWNTFKIIAKQSPQTVDKIAIGPWAHGGWARGDGSRLGNVQFGKGISDYYYKNIEMPFFNYYLKGEGNGKDLAKANIFISGENAWHEFSEWPPQNMKPRSLYLQGDGQLSFQKPAAPSGYSEYVSDPSKPVPYTEDVHLHRTREYMTDDQRFASRRPDVLVYKTDTLGNDLTLTGPLLADLFVSISTTDADFIVKLIDVFPDTFSYKKDTLRRQMVQSYPMGGYQMLIRGEVIRGKFRNSFEKPEGFTPGKVTEVKFEMPDVAHTFQKGHRIMIQIQSSWFPLVDRNPQQFLDIYHCDKKDFIKSTIRIYHDSKNASFIQLPVLNK